MSTTPSTYSEAAKIAETITFEQFAELVAADDNPFVFPKPKSPRRIAMNLRICHASTEYVGTGIVFFDYCNRKGFSDSKVVSFGWGHDAPIFVFGEDDDVRIVRVEGYGDRAFEVEGEPEFGFETVEKTHAEIEATDQIVGVRIDGELVARFLDSNGRDWISGSFYDGEGIDEDRNGSRTFVVAVERRRPHADCSTASSNCDGACFGYGFAVDPEFEVDDVCPACGDPVDYCQGHGEIGDPEGFAFLAYVEACEDENLEAYDREAWIVRGRPTGPLGDAPTVGLDYCQTCGERVLDHDENGFEDETGQRGHDFHEGDTIFDENDDDDPTSVFAEFGPDEDAEPDFSDATHCRHGSYVGDWAGPDYLCGWCEDGVSVVEMLEARAFECRVAVRARELVAENVYDSLVAFGVRESLSVGRLGTYLVDGVLAAAECFPPASFVRAARAELVEVGA